MGEEEHGEVDGEGGGGGVKESRGRSGKGRVKEEQ